MGFFRFTPSCGRVPLSHSKTVMGICCHYHDDFLNMCWTEKQIIKVLFNVSLFLRSMCVCVMCVYSVHMICVRSICMQCARKNRVLPCLRVHMICMCTVCVHIHSLCVYNCVCNLHISARCVLLVCINSLCGCMRCACECTVYEWTGMFIKMLAVIITRK